VTNTDLLLVYGLLALPLAVSALFGLRRTREIVVAVVRMTVQLGLIGLYIEGLFRIDSPWLNALWIAVMISVAGSTILRQSGIHRRPLVLAAVVASLVPGILLPVGVLLLAVRPDPWYTAAMVVPLVGMVLGNSLRGNIIALSRLREGLAAGRVLYASRLMAGATRREALVPLLRDALQASLAPQIASISTIGLVSLPGMMTGQILGGASPITALRYQIAIMLTILAAVALAAVLNLVVAGRLLVDDHDMPILRER
jgi:putative ABC transport system permease protein